MFNITNAQEQKQIEIKYAGRLNVDEANYPGARILTRDASQQVHVAQGSIDIWCDKAIYYGGENFVEAYGNVSAKQGDTINLRSKYIEYSGKTQLAYASGNVVLTDPTSEIQTDTLYFDRAKQQSYYQTGGKVVKDSSGTITSRIGRYYMETKKYKFQNNVVLVNDEATIESNFFDYYSDTGHAYVFGPSTITTKDSKTYCEKGFYDTELKIGYAMKKAKIYYNNKIIEGDSLYFDNNRSFASSTNNIKITDTVNNTIAKGHYAEIFKAKDSLFITKRALVITVQEKDSIYLHADKIMVTGKPDHRITKAYYNAKLFKSDISAKADSIVSNQETGLTELINLDRFSSKGDAFSTKKRPILWNLENQMTGDTIHLISNQEAKKLDSLVVYENAFVIAKDTLTKDGYNQIKGLELIGLFDEDNRLRDVYVNKNAESIFYSRNEEQELIGIDKSKSGSIEMTFADGEIQKYTRLNNIDATLYKETEFPEKEKYFKGFDWREEERPKSVEDLFKDDPPLVLPKIKGLDDYVPQDDFFDEALLDRIQKADEESKTPDDEVQKASRHLPDSLKTKSDPIKKPAKALKSKPLNK